MASKTAVNVQSPRGELEWVFNTGDGKKNKYDKYKYQGSVIVPDAEAQPFKDQIDAFWKENKPKGAKKAATKGYRNQSVKSDEVDEDGDAIYVDVPGFTEFFFSTNATWPAKDGKAPQPRKIAVINSKNQPIEFTQRIGNGSIGRLGGIMDIYDFQGNAGINLYFGAVKLLKFVAAQDGPSFEADDDDAEYDAVPDSDKDETFTGDEEQVEESSTTSKPRL